MKTKLLLLTLLLNSIFLYTMAQEADHYLINFDTGSNYIHIDTSAQNLWRIGVPHKTFFNPESTSGKAIVTDTMNNYPINNHSFFDLYIGDFNYEGFYPYDIFIMFNHKFDTDDHKDGCYITVSWDKGQSWVNIIEDTIYPYCTPSNPEYFQPQNLYGSGDSLFNGERGYSGHSNGWVTTQFSWYDVPTKDYFSPDTMILRFNFISDSIPNQKEGWMIDDILLYSVYMSGMKNTNDENNLLIYPQPANASVGFSFSQNFKTIGLDIFDMQGRLVRNDSYYNCSKIQFNRDNLVPGLYMVKLTLNGNNIITKKIIFD